MSRHEPDGGNGITISNIVAVVMAVVALAQFLETQEANRRAEAANKRADASAERAFKLQTAIAYDERERASREAKLARAPLLVVQKCCNPVPIVIRPDNSPDIDVFRIDLRKLDTVDPTKIRIDEDVRARRERAFVARIRNLGQGVAIGVKAFWEIDKIVLSDGRFATVKDEDVNGHLRPYLWPATLQSGDVGDLVHLPTFMMDDEALQIASVSGLLKLSCTDTEEQPHTFYQPFTIDTVYAPTGKDDYLGTRLNFHFFEPSEAELPHTVAKPMLDP